MILPTYKPMFELDEATLKRYRQDAADDQTPRPE